MNMSSKDSSSTSSSEVALDDRLFLDCVHCGLCTSACPTYVELGNENDSPRGRIYLMRAVNDGRLELNRSVRRHLELCLDCRACETACPSGVQYGRLIEPFRIAMEEDTQSDEPPKTQDWFHRWILFGLFPNRARMKAAMQLARWGQRFKLDQLVLKMGLQRVLPPRLQQLVTMLPPLPQKPLPDLPREFKAIGKRRARVAMFRGCVGDVMFQQTQWATARVLQANGCDVVVPENQTCCGAIHFHAGSQQPAREMADQNVQQFPTDVDAIVVNVAGCGSMLKDYGHHWHDNQQAARSQFADRVKDVHLFLDQLGLVPPQQELNEKVTYHDACHLVHAQGVRDAPRNLLRQIPGLELVELVESELCCGAAGTYNLTEPEMSKRLAQRKLQHILDTGANTIATGNAGCLLQIAREARQQGHVLRVVHPIDLLAEAYGVHG